MSVQFWQLAEHELDASLAARTMRLRNLCFPDHRVDRSYYKQLPHWRHLAQAQGTLVGHLGIDHRVVRVGEAVVPVFGLIDLGVHPSWRGRGLGAGLLDQASRLAAQSTRVDFLLGFTFDTRLYRREGFDVLETASVTWLRIDDHRNYGLAQEQLRGEVVVRSIRGKPWPGGPIDMLGCLF